MVASQRRLKQRLAVSTRDMIECAAAIRPHGADGGPGDADTSGGAGSREIGTGDLVDTSDGGGGGAVDATPDTSPASRTSGSPMSPMSPSGLDPRRVADLESSLVRRASELDDAARELRAAIEASETTRRASTEATARARELEDALRSRDVDVEAARFAARTFPWHSLVFNLADNTLTHALTHTHTHTHTHKCTRGHHPFLRRHARPRVPNPCVMTQARGDRRATTLCGARGRGCPTCRSVWCSPSKRGRRKRTSERGRCTSRQPCCTMAR
jgi:hypothetical protein